MEDTIVTIKTICGLIGMYLGCVIGPMTGLLTALCILMALDYLTGVVNAILTHTLSSEVGFRGLARKIFILVLVGVGYLLDTYVVGGSSGAVRNLVICWYIANEGISILENAAVLGLPIPGRLRDVLEQLKEQSDNGKSNHADG